MTQGMLPFPALFTSTDGGIVGKGIGQNSSLRDPVPAANASVIDLYIAPLTSTEDGNAVIDIGQNSGLLHYRQNTQGLLPLLALPTRTEGSQALTAAV